MIDSVRQKEKPIQQLDLEKRKHIHLVGIGGAGMGGIAEVLLNQGHSVSGSDTSQNSVTERLQKLGATIYLGHDAVQIKGADTVVVSTAIDKMNPEVQAALQQGLPLLQRAQMLAEIMQDYYGIAISGTHGKTTTTSLVATILAEAGLDPTFVIGGLLKGAGTHAKLGTGNYFVAEADESDASFLYLYPKVTIVTNIDADHLSTYNGDFAQLKATFLKFLSQLPEEGLAVVCIDDPVIAELLPYIERPVLTYGFNAKADIQGLNYHQEGTRSYYKIYNRKTDTLLTVQLNLPGVHNALNAMAAYAVAYHLNVEEKAILAALSSFAGVGRRFQLLGELSVSDGKALLIDDYGHHPREVAATIAAARGAWPTRRLVMAYQPHRYTRTQELWNDFVAVLSSVDELILLDIYSAGEPPIPTITGNALHQAILAKGKLTATFVESVHDLPLILQKIVRDGDVVLMQGAGNIGAVTAKLAKEIASAK